MESVVSQELDYKVRTVSHPTYQLSQVIQQAGGLTSTISVAGGNESIFELPPKVMNLSKSVLSFTTTPAASASTNIMHIDGITTIKQIQLYTRTGVFLCDLTDVHKYTNITIRRNTSKSELMTMDNGSAAAGFFEGLRHASFEAVTSENHCRPALTAGTMTGVSLSEPSYVIAGTNAAADPVVAHKIKLGRIYDTIFSINKDQYFNDTVYLRIVWGKSPDCMYRATAANDIITGAAAYASDIALTNLRLFLAVEQNPVINQEIMSKAHAGTLTYQVPYVYYNKVNVATSTTHNVSVRYNRAHGRKLKKIYWAPYHSNETGRLTYDKNNIAVAGAADKVSEYYTMVNNTRLTQFNYNTVVGDDWMDKRELLLNSSIGTSNEYYYNWVHVEDFSHIQSLKYKDHDESNLDDGLILENEVKYDIASTTAAVALAHYVYAVCLKDITISNAGITLI